jgi:hypothetical protein
MPFLGEKENLEKKWIFYYDRKQQQSLYGWLVSFSFFFFLKVTFDL